MAGFGYQGHEDVRIVGPLSQRDVKVLQIVDALSQEDVGICMVLNQISPPASKVRHVLCPRLECKSAHTRLLGENVQFELDVPGKGLCNELPYPLDNRRRGISVSLAPLRQLHCQLL